MVFTITNVVQAKIEDKGCVWKEILLSLIVSIPFFTHGLETTTLTSSAHAGHFITTDGVPWSTTVMVLAAGISAPIFCYFIDKFGRKLGLFCVSMVQAASLIPLLKNTTISMTMLHILAGISAGGLFTVIPIYVREITSSHGFCIAVMTVLTSAGYMIEMVMSSEMRLLLMVGLVTLQFISLLVMVESPSYNVMIKKFESAQLTLAKLKRLPMDDQHVLTEISKLKYESDRATSHGKLSPRLIRQNKIWLDAMKIGLMVYTIKVLCGSIVFLDQDKTLAQLKITPDPHSTLVLGSLLLGCFICSILIIFFDRKYVLILGYIIMTLATGVLAVYTQRDLTVTSSTWIPITSFCVLVVGYGITWSLPGMIVVEILNLEIRATLMGVIYAYFQLIKLIHIHTFKYVEEYMGIYTAFYIFACINLFGVVYTLFEVPRIKNKTVKQIEKQLRRPSLPA